jgi:hypothetical protein
MKTDENVKNYYQMKLRLLREENNRLRNAIVVLEMELENEVKETC